MTYLEIFLVESPEQKKETSKKGFRGYFTSVHLLASGSCHLHIHQPINFTLFFPSKKPFHINKNRVW